MKKLILVIFCLMFLGVGCSEPMANDDIIAETKKCEEAGLIPGTLRDGWTNEVLGIQCYPKRDKDK